MNGKGTVIMTYGYSGVGKSASMFGQPGENGNFTSNNGSIWRQCGYIFSCIRNIWCGTKI